MGQVFNLPRSQIRQVENLPHKKITTHLKPNSTTQLKNNASETETQNDAPDLIINDDDRYSRLRLIGWWDQSLLSRSHVIVVGAGALGNEVLKNLALVGIGKITLIDFDTINNSNLSRSVLFRDHHSGMAKATVAAAAIREINPDCKIRELTGDVMADIGLGLVRDVATVICCVDNREARLWINRMCWKVGTPWIDGGIQEINGVAKVFSPPDGACYECVMTERDYQLIQLRYSCPLLKQEDLLQGKVPTAPTIASMIGGMQAQEALKLIHGLETDTGTAMVFNGVANNFYKSKFSRREDCLSHETYDDPIELPLSAGGNTVSELVAAVEKETGSKFQSIELDRDFLISLECVACEVKETVREPKATVDMKRAICKKCEQVMRLDSISQLTPDAEMGGTSAGDLKLKEIGIPDYDIVKVTTEGGPVFVLLAEDREIISDFS